VRRSTTAAVKATTTGSSRVKNVKQRARLPHLRHRQTSSPVCKITLVLTLLQCFDAVGWTSRRAFSNPYRCSCAAVDKIITDFVSRVWSCLTYNDGDADATVEFRIRIGWYKFIAYQYRCITDYERKVVQQLCVVKQ